MPIDSTALSGPQYIDESLASAELSTTTVTKSPDLHSLAAGWSCDPTLFTSKAAPAITRASTKSAMFVRTWIKPQSTSARQLVFLRLQLSRQSRKNSLRRTDILRCITVGNPGCFDTLQPGLLFLRLYG